MPGNERRPGAGPAARPLPGRAWLLVVGGVAALFVAPASYRWQVVVIAPLAEEMIKLGMTLVVLAAVSWAGRACPMSLAAAGVGAGFGAIEAWALYAEGGIVDGALRMAFHGGTAILAITAWHGARARRPWVRLALALLAPFLWHAVANTVALVWVRLPGMAAARVTNLVFIAGIFATVALLRWAGRSNSHPGPK